MRVLSLGLAVIALFLVANRADAAPGSAVVVRVVTASVKPHTDVLTLTGDVMARTSSALSFRVSGRISERYVDVGDQVGNGQLLARLDPSQQLADVANAEASLAAAEAASRQAASAFDRQKVLLDKGFTTQSAFDDARKAVRTTQGSIDAAQASLDIARANLAYTELRADADGIVTARSADAGEVAPAATPIFTIAVAGPRDAVFDVSEQLFLGITTLPDVAISLVNDPTVTTPGQVREVSPTVDTATGTVRVKVDIGTPPAAMNLGAPITGRIPSRTAPAVVLPARALFSLNNRPAVWVIGADGATVDLRPVTVSSYQTDDIVIASGLADGDQVVTDGGKLLWPGASVTPVAEERP